MKTTFYTIILNAMITLILNDQLQSINFCDFSAKMVNRFCSFIDTHTIKLQIFTFIFVGVLTTSCKAIEVQFTIPTPSTPSKQLMSNSLSLRELWRWSGYIRGDKKPPKILVSDGKIIIVSSTEKGDKVVVFEARTGRTIWESSPTFEQIQSITVDNENVYAGYMRYVQTYDLETGKKHWVGAEQSKYKKGDLYVYAKKKQVDVYDASSNWPYDERLLVLDAHTGETINTMEWPRIFFRDETIVFTRTGPSKSGFGLSAHDEQTKQQLWHLTTSAYPLRWPLLIDNTMYLEAGDIYALDANTGEVQWQSRANYATDPSTGKIKWQLPNNDRVPRIAYSTDFLYTIRNDAAIVGINAETGQEVGIIEVSPPPLSEDEYGTALDIYYIVAACDEYVIVYYQDSQELIAFEKVGDLDGEMK